jgi:hypothetical protein
LSHPLIYFFSLSQGSVKLVFRYFDDNFTKNPVFRTKLNFCSGAVHKGRHATRGGGHRYVTTSLQALRDSCVDPYRKTMEFHIKKLYECALRTLSILRGTKKRRKKHHPPKELPYGFQYGFHMEHFTFSTIWIPTTSSSTFVRILVHSRICTMLPTKTLPLYINFQKTGKSK